VAGFPRRVLSVLLTPQILLMLAKVYLPVLFPLTLLIALLALQLDGVLGFGGGFLPRPLNFWLAAASFGLGVAIWLVAYAAIVFEGKGSPSPTAGRTQQLVTTGIYGLCRYPSVHGKFWGVLAVGLALDSFSFCCILSPLLLAGSLVEKLWRQEPKNEAVFGEAYRRYRDEVPFFIPWKAFF
jgi:protein-S-isoprenylcysteine O-methyltransferase Ste14